MNVCPFRELLVFLYGGQTAESVLPRLLGMLEGFSGPRETVKPGLPFTHRDAFLISYGDMLSAGADTDAGETGLARLFRFLEKRNEGAFSYIHILPFHPYTSDDGFSVVNYREVDPRFGSWDDLAKLAELDGGGKNARLVFDLVINHGSVQSPWFRAFLSGCKKYAGWYITRPASYDYSAVVRPRTHPLLTAFTKKDEAGNEETVHVWTTFSADQVDYDFSNPEVLLEFIGILLEYARRGAGIVRLDAIAYLWKEDGSSCLHHPKTHAVVKLFRALVDCLGLSTLILTETNVPHAENISYFGGTGEGLDLPEAHMVYNFALPPLALHAAVSGDAGPLRAWAKTLPGPGARQYFLNFLASHDGIGLTPAKGLVDEAAFAATIEEAKKRGALVSYKSTPAGDIPYELNCSLAQIIAPENADWALAEGSPEKAAGIRARAFLAVHAVQCSLSGLPAVYFHSWAGSETWREGPALLGYNRAINREKPPVRKVEAELDDPASFRFHVYRGFTKLLLARKNEEAFNPDREQITLDAEGGVFALLRTQEKSASKLLCLVNLRAKPAVWNVSEQNTGLVPAEYSRVHLAPWEALWVRFENGAPASRFSTAEP